MKSTSSFFILTVIAALFALGSCKNRTNTADNTEKQIAERIQNLDVVAFANLYCKTTDLDKARIFLGKTTDSLFTVMKDVENNYAKVYANSKYENSLEFYMWTDKDGAKVLGVYLLETAEKGVQKSLQFYTYDARLNMAVPYKRLNEIFTDYLMSIRKKIKEFALKIPTSPENENIYFEYWDKQKNHHEIVFVWDGKTFKVE